MNCLRCQVAYPLYELRDGRCPACMALERAELIKALESYLADIERVLQALNSVTIMATTIRKYYE
jgi:hypothetical protein